MTVRELIAFLERCDPDMAVHLEVVGRDGDSLYGHAQTAIQSHIAGVVLIDNRTTS